MKKTLLILSLTISTSAFAGFMDTLSSVSSAVVGKKGTAEATATVSTTPLATSEMSTMDCPTILVTLSNSKRELEQTKVNLANIEKLKQDPNYQKKQMASGAASVLGGLFADKGGNAGQAAQMAQNIGSSQSTTGTALDFDLQTALNKKYSVDIDNLAIYKKQKKCK